MSLTTSVKRPNSHSRSEGQFRKSREKFIHFSQTFAPKFDANDKIVGFVANVMRTPIYNVGRNAAKRVAR